MNPIALVIHFIDGSQRTIEAVAADLIAFESKFDLSVVRLESEIRLSHLFYIAWHALHRQGETDGKDFESWSESVSMVSQAEEKKSKG